MENGSFNIIKLDEDSLKLCSGFLIKARGVSLSSPSLSVEYLRWKYLIPKDTLNICLLLERDGIVCSIVGASVWRYIMSGKVVNVCFPVDWYSTIDSPVKGAGKKVLKSLIEMFPVSIGVGGTPKCFQPQISVGFRDIGSVSLLRIDGKSILGFRDFARRCRDSVFHPVRSWKGNNLGRSFTCREQVIFKVEKLDENKFINFDGWQLFSHGVQREDMVQKWKHYIFQPFNQATIISVRFRGKISFILICNFTDSRKGYLGFADAILDHNHSVMDAISAFAAYVSYRNATAGLFMTGDPEIIMTAIASGYRICDNLRTQYLSQAGWPVCNEMSKCPSVSFLSSDEMTYRGCNKH